MRLDHILLLLFFALLSIISVRERGPFWRSRPSRALTIGLVADALVIVETVNTKVDVKKIDKGVALTSTDPAQAARRARGL